MQNLNRRDFLKASVLPAAVVAIGAKAGQGGGSAPSIIDTNVHLFDWPFRRLKYSRTGDLVEKLRKHRISQAWAGSFEGLLHKNLDEANARLAAECREHGAGMLVPFGTVNPVWPGWEEDLRRCHEQYGMPGVRLYPSYHAYTLDEPVFAEFLDAAARRGMIVQIAVSMEDFRVHHPIVDAPTVNAAPLVEVLKKVPRARVQLLNAWEAMQGESFSALLAETGVSFDISTIEGEGGLGRLIAGNHWVVRGRVPPERLLFGSHAPMFPCESAVLKLFESPLEPPELRAIMRGAAERLIKPASDAGKPAESFVLDPADYGVPGREELAKLRIWDLHYHGLNASGGIEQYRETMFYVERMGIERVFALDIGVAGNDPFAESDMDARQREILEEKGRTSGIIPIDPSDPVASLRKMDQWIRHGPCVGIKYAGFNRDGVPCSHENNDPIIRLAGELNALVYIHTWLKVGGSPRRPGGGNNPGESTPMDVAALAARFPQVPLICGHSGGDWELGVRAIRELDNVYFEFAGSDPHSGQVDLAVKELGTDRIVWGGHGPSRSYATELSKVLDADLSREQRMQILGGNLRRLARPIFKQKGYPI